MGLRKKAKKFLENILFNKGYILEKITDINKLNNLLKKLSPVATDKNLIRIGSINDGGYIVPNVLEDIKYCYSAGIGFNYDFEFELAKKVQQIIDNQLVVNLEILATVIEFAKNAPEEDRHKIISIAQAIAVALQKNKLVLPKDQFELDFIASYNL
jgi:hypothetical protein